MIQPVILAAGKGSRMRSSLPKVLHEVQGKPMLEWVLDACKSVKGYLKPIVVVGYGAPQVRTRFGKRARFALQSEALGTASAVKSALPLLSKKTKAVLIIYGDQPFLKKDTLMQIAQQCSTDTADMFVGVVTVPHFNDNYKPFNSFGRIVNGTDGAIERVLEYSSASPTERGIRELNAGLCLVRTEWLLHALPLLTPNTQTGEYYVTDLVLLARNEGKLVSTFTMEPKESLGINSPEDAAWVETF